jgi:hypothetical protein
VAAGCAPPLRAARGATVGLRPADTCDRWAPADLPADVETGVDADVETAVGAPASAEPSSADATAGANAKVTPTPAATAPIFSHRTTGRTRVEVRVFT